MKLSISTEYQVTSLTFCFWDWNSCSKPKIYLWCTNSLWHRNEQNGGNDIDTPLIFAETWFTHWCLGNVEGNFLLPSFCLKADLILSHDLMLAIPSFLFQIALNCNNCKILSTFFPVQRFSVLCSPILSCKKSLFVGSIGEFLICLSAPIVGAGELSGESWQVLVWSWRLCLHLWVSY